MCATIGGLKCWIAFDCLMTPDAPALRFLLVQFFDDEAKNVRLVRHSCACSLLCDGMLCGKKCMWDVLGVRRGAYGYVTSS